MTSLCNQHLAVNTQFLLQQLTHNWFSRKQRKWSLHGHEQRKRSINFSVLLERSQFSQQMQMQIEFDSATSSKQMRLTAPSSEQIRLRSVPPSAPALTMVDPFASSFTKTFNTTDGSSFLQRFAQQHGRLLHSDQQVSSFAVAAYLCIFSEQSSAAIQ